MADLIPYSVLQQFIPGITDYRIETARQHTIQHGRGVPLPVSKSPRMRVDNCQLDHFLCFITSPHVVQDLPFGRRYLYLSNGKMLETPNVIRSVIPQRIINQYNQFCSESNFTPLAPATMFRILSSCTATVRKSLQGLDYFAAEGAKAFDDLIEIAGKLGDRQWALRSEQELKEGKQYLKTDYKVGPLELLIMCIKIALKASHKKKELVLGTTNIFLTKDADALMNSPFPSSRMSEVWCRN